ncbi:Retinaldehyde-binding protein 1-like protein 1 [Heterocephalus glaber]|uniref:Retinaldehyde-binding protein 1-like protein 1 n=1 Tax=Heterocephalus glaber TaxID=10181 RepID=G5C4V7_HETGA|nr:Retinaldehyde-binding protein 1-like protein 1 [Heterocephalus glaber]
MGPVFLLPKHQKLSTWKGDLAKMTHLQAGLSPDTIEKARLELNENPDVLHQDIQQVRDMIITRPDIGFLRTDDAFILRFLRARKFHQADAFRLLAQYFQYRQLNLDMFKNFKADDPGIKRALIDGFPGVLENRDHYGRKILLLFAANWDQTKRQMVTQCKPRSYSVTSSWGSESDDCALQVGAPEVEITHEAYC